MNPWAQMHGAQGVAPELGDGASAWVAFESHVADGGARFSEGSTVLDRIASAGAQAA